MKPLRQPEAHLLFNYAQTVTSVPCLLFGTLRGRTKINSMFGMQKAAPGHYGVSATIFRLIFPSALPS